MVAGVNGVAGDELRGGEGIQVDSEFGVAVVSGQSVGLCLREGGRVLGGESREGEALVAMESAGAWRRPNRLDSGKMAFPYSTAGKGNNRSIT